MKKIKIIYNDKTSEVLKLFKDFQDVIIEIYDCDFPKEKKKAIPIITRNGGKSLPLIVFENEKLEEYAVYWPESKKLLNLDLINEYLNMPQSD